MKKIYTLITSLILSSTILHAQYSVVYDNTWYSETESSNPSAMLDDENNIYLYMEGVQVLNGNQSYKYLQKIGPNNQVLWTKTNGINLYSRCVGFDENNYPLIWGGTSSNSFLVRIDKNSGNRLDSLNFGPNVSGYVERESNGDYLIYNSGSTNRIYTKRFDINRNLIWEVNSSGNTTSSDHNHIRLGNRYYFVHTNSSSYPSIYYQNLNNGQFQPIYTFWSYPERVFFNEDTTVISLLSNGTLIKIDVKTSNNEDPEILRQNASINNYFVKNKENFIPLGGSYVNGSYQVSAHPVSPYILNQPFDQRKIGGVFYTGYVGASASQNNLKIFSYTGGTFFNYDFNFNLISFSKSNTDCILLAGRIIHEGLNNARLVKICSATASTNELETTNFTLYPNPTNTEITIQFEETSSVPSSVRLLDLTGKEVLQQNTNSALELTLDVRKLAPGTYLLQAGNQTRKVIIE